MAGDNGLYASASLDAPANEIVLKLVNTTGGERAIQIQAGAAAASRKGRAIVMTADLRAQNTFAEPKRVAPMEGPLSVPGGTFERTLPAHSLTVLRLPAK